MVNEKYPNKLAFEPSGVSIVGRTARNYAVAVLAVLAATAVRFLAGGFLAEQPFVTFFLATMVVVVFAGSGPGVLATLLSVISAKYFFLAPIGSFEIHDPKSLAKTAIFTVIGLALCVTAELISRRRRAAGDAMLTFRQDAVARRGDEKPPGERTALPVIVRNELRWNCHG